MYARLGDLALIQTSLVLSFECQLDLHNESSEVFIETSYSRSPKLAAMHSKARPLNRQLYNRAGGAGEGGGGL